MRSVENPFPGPRPYAEGERLCGRDREVQGLFDLLLARHTVLVHGPSGAGKSSLINAGLIPRLKGQGGARRPERNFVVIPAIHLSAPTSAETTGDISALVLAQVVRSLGDHSVIDRDGVRWSPGSDERSPDGASLKEVLQSFSLQPERGEGPAIRPPIVLVFDPFEDILSVEDEASRLDFLEQLGAALQLPRVWAILACRDEDVGQLIAYRRFFPDHLSGMVRLDLLRGEAARAAITLPTQETVVEFDASAGQAVRNFLTGASQAQDARPVDTLELQIVCRQLWSERRAADPRGADSMESAPVKITAQQVPESMLRGLRDRFIEQAILSGSRAFEHTAMRHWRLLRVLRWLRDNYIVDGKYCRLHHHSPDERPRVEELEQRRIVRIVRRGVIEYSELSHRRLIGPILGYLAVIRRVFRIRFVIGAGVLVMIVMAIFLVRGFGGGSV